MVWLAMVPGCIPDGGAPFVEVVSDSDPDVTAAELLSDESSTVLGTRRLGTIAGDVGEVRYDGDAQKRIYLLSGDVRAGISSGAALHLPQQPVPWPDSSSPLVVDIDDFDPNQWTSLRAYDVGLCSAPPDETFAPQLKWAELAEAFIHGLDAGFKRDLLAERTQPGSFTPVVRAGNTYDAQGDRFRFHVTYFAPRIGDRLGCDDVTLDITGELGWARRPAVISYPPQCLSESDPGHTIVTADGQTWDFVGVIESLAVEAHSSGCIVLSDIEDGVADGLRASLPRSFGRAILDALLVDPNEYFDVPVEDIRPCTCDTECSDLSPQGPIPYGPPGRRHRCKLTRLGAHPCGECWIQLDPDRVQARPEGLEVVLAEDEADPQAASLEASFAGSVFLCSEQRLSVEAGTTPLRLELPGTIDVAAGPPAPTEPSCRREEL